MRIGIDIDDTIANTAVFFDRVIKEKNITELKGDYYNNTIEELKKYDLIVKDYIDEVLKSCTVKENCSGVIKRLKQKGHDIYIISARSNYFSPNVYDITLDFLKNNNIIYDELLFGYESKRNICIEKCIDIMIDDNIKVYESLKDTNIKTILFSTSHNQNSDALRVNNWLELEKIIDKIS